MSEPRLRVCFVIQKLLNLSGGAERVFLTVAAAMARRGMDVEVLIYDNTVGEPCFDTDGLTITNIFPAPLRRRQRSQAHPNKTSRPLKRFPTSGPLGHFKWAITHGLFAFRLKNALRRRRPDVIIAFLPPAITAAVSAGGALDVPVIASTHNLPEEDFGLASPRWDQNPIYRHRARMALSRAARITILQDDFRRWFTPEQQERLHVIPNPIGRLGPAPSPAVEREKLVLVVGRLTKVKNCDLLIEAWRRIHTDFPDWRVRIYGNGPERTALDAQISAAGLRGIVELFGVTQNLGPLYDRASLLCHPARFEGFGLAVAEAMAHGTPAMGFDDCPGINRLITHGIDGILLDGSIDRTEALTTGLRHALSHPESLRPLGEQAITAVQAYAPDKIADRWESLIRRCENAEPDTGV